MHKEYTYICQFGGGVKELSRKDMQSKEQDLRSSRVGLSHLAKKQTLRCESHLMVTKINFANYRAIGLYSAIRIKGTNHGVQCASYVSSHVLCNHEIMVYSTQT